MAQNHPTSSAPAAKKAVPHAFTRVILSWSYCQGCGLVLLRNKRTQAAAAKPCYKE